MEATFNKSVELHPKKKKFGSQPWEAVFKKFVEANYGDKVSLSQMFKQSNGSKPSFIGLLSSF